MPQENWKKVAAVYLLPQKKDAAVTCTWACAQTLFQLRKFAHVQHFWSWILECYSDIRKQFEFMSRLSLSGTRRKRSRVRQQICIHIRYCTGHPSYYTSYLYWGSEGSTAKWCEVNNASNLESFKFTLKLSSTISSWFAFLFLLFLLFLFSLSIIPFRLKCCRSSLSSIKSNSSSSLNWKQIKQNRKLN